MAPSPPVRGARPGDEPSLLALQGELDAPNPELLRTGLAGVGVVLVSPEEGTDRPVGYLLGIPGGEAVHVAELAVAPEYRREGRASGLVEALAGRTGAREITIAVAPENGAARACYESLGFEVRKRDPGYFDGDPAVIMAR